ncbi:MAG TPA: DUF5683 domain-containing protein [Candidatus Eisenbacteria bacterium]
MDAPPARRSPAAADSSAYRSPRPFFVMLRSAAVPGLGQVTNRAWIKAVVVLAGEGYLGSRAWRSWRRELDAVDRANAAAALADQARLNSDPAGEAMYEAAYDRYLTDVDRHANSKINFIWWTAAAHVLQMADAYVDAHFVRFDAEFGPDDRDASGSLGGPRLTLAFRARF